MLLETSGLLRQMQFASFQLKNTSQLINPISLRFIGSSTPPSRDTQQFLASDVKVIG